MKKDIDILLAKYFGGNASAKDMEAIEHWLSSSAENQTYFDEMTSLYAKLGGVAADDIPKPNVERARKSFSAYMAMHNGKSVPVTRGTFTKQWMFRAASIAIIMVLSVSVWKFFFAEHQVVFATQLAPKQNTLSDQTNIKLAENSKITYSSNYGKRYRTIHLDGKATFKVGHAGKGTLQVCADEIIIEDIGTVFEVSAYKDSNLVSVKVNEGQVHFFTKQDKGLMLGANDTGIYNKKTKCFTMLEPALEKESSGSLRVNFRGIQLAEAFDIIRKAYGVSINLREKQIANRQITVKFEGEDLDMVLHVIAETLDLNLEKSSSGYLFSNKKLN
jgi:ferric-dicitrate binding protein FerR (iron transport regulator)